MPTAPFTFPFPLPELHNKQTELKSLDAEGEEISCNERYHDEKSKIKQVPGALSYVRSFEPREGQLIQSLAFGRRPRCL